MIFSASVPLIPVFGFLFFTLKYFIDKYNLIFVYPTEFLSKGIIQTSVTSFTTFALLLFQILMFTFFTTIFGDDFFIAAGILLCGEVIMIFVFWFIFEGKLGHIAGEDEEEERTNLGQHWATEDA